MTWSSEGCSSLARDLLGGLGNRWMHVQGVAELVSGWVSHDRAPNVVLCAAWLHDIGYARGVGTTGMHAVDGATHLAQLGAPRDLVSLVAFHSGAEYEALERDMIDKLIPFELPEQQDLDALTLADLVTGPTGERVTVEARLAEILARYEPQHPVHRAVQRSRPYLIESAARAAERLGYPM